MSGEGKQITDLVAFLRDPPFDPRCHEAATALDAKSALLAEAMTALEPFATDARLMKALRRHLHLVNQGAEIALERLNMAAAEMLAKLKAEQGLLTAPQLKTLGLARLEECG